MIDKKLVNTIYIISKGRPQCKTAKTLMKMNYPGRWFIVCGNNDPTIPEYQKNWGKDKILIFDWYEEVKHSDLLDNFGVEKMGSGAVPVRNATRKISVDRGELRHWQFDDDYNRFWCINSNNHKTFHPMEGKEFEKKLYNLANYGHFSHIYNVGFAVPNESMPDSRFHITRRVFNAHNMDNHDLEFTTWKARMNDDLINAMDTWKKGKYEISFKFMLLNFKETQSEKGGNTEIYKAHGTVRKTAYAIMFEPKAVKLIEKFGRYHHQVDWRKVVPKLIHEKYR